MLRKRLVSLSQIALVFVICALAYVYGPALAPEPAGADTAGRLAFAVQWLAIPGLMLLVCVMLTSLTRFVSHGDGFGGTRTPASRFLEINIRVTQNTLEQSVLAAVAWLGLAVALPPERLGIVPVLAVLFAVGRVAFWIGYQIHPLARALGFGLTAIPSAVAIVWLSWRLVAVS